MLKELNIGEAEVEKLYSDFIEHCFPAFSMTLYSFINYMTKYSYQKNDSRFPSLFNAFNYEKNGFLSFHELLLGLASMEPTTSNREARIKFVFRYYDSDGDEFLCEDEFKKLIEDIAPECDENKLKTKYEEAIQAIGVKNNKISLQDFCKAVGSKTFRGTSNLCRSSKAILSQISQSITDRTEERSTAQKTSAGFLKANRRNKGICYGCKGKKYDYSLHSIKLDYNGRCVEPRRIFERKNILFIYFFISINDLLIFLFFPFIHL
jgi:Ca2+-binding EF-hand superfamily protein